MSEKVFVTGSDTCTHPRYKEVEVRDEYEELQKVKVQVRFDEGDNVQRCGDCGKVWKEL